MLRATALITGASRGHGLALARFLAEQDYDLIIDARQPDVLDFAATELSGVTNVIALVGSVTDGAHRAKLAEAASDGLDLLVHNASDLGPTPLPELRALQLDDLRQVLETNLVAPLALTQALLPALRARGGRVVSLSSDAAGGGYPGWGAYGASKAALDLISATWAQELSADGITVVSLDPGDMRTAMQRRAFPDDDLSDRPEPEVTLPWWAWFLAQAPADVNGGRFLAQADVWLSGPTSETLDGALDAGTATDREDGEHGATRGGDGGGGDGGGGDGRGDDGGGGTP